MLKLIRRLRYLLRRYNAEEELRDIGLNTSLFSTFDAFMWRPWPVKDPDRIVTVVDQYTRAAFSLTERDHFALGVVCGVAGAIAASQILRSQLHGLSPFDPVAYAGVAAVLTIVAVAATIVPARRGDPDRSDRRAPVRVASRSAGGIHAQAAQANQVLPAATPRRH
jgi:hypothetical protein